MYRVIISFIAIGFNYHRDTESGPADTASLPPLTHLLTFTHLPQYHKSDKCFLCPEQLVLTQFLLILPHQSKNMKQAHHLFMARVYRSMISRTVSEMRK